MLYPKFFPTLYKKASNGALLEWTIIVEKDAEIITRHGQVGGQIQEARETIKAGKNIGKKNETSPAQQALAEAEAEWTKKKARNGYVEDIERARAGETDQDGGVAPMLAKPVEDVNAKHLRWPAHAQPKLDGVRCIAVVTATDAEPEVTLWSRKREQIKGVPHVVEALKQACAGIAGTTVLDGELYTHGLGFQRITSFTRSKTPKPGHEQIQYHVYDVVIEKLPWNLRHECLQEILYNATVRPVQTVHVASMDLVKTLHDQWVQEGYEGAMLRQKTGLYEPGKRSPHLTKIKAFQDAEFKILDCKEGRGKFEGKAVFVCERSEDLPQPVTFDCCAPGTMEDRARYFADPTLWKGKQLTVKYFGFTDDGKPRFPVGKDIRQGD